MEQEKGCLRRQPLLNIPKFEVTLEYWPCDTAHVPKARYCRALVLTARFWIAFVLTARF